MARMMVESRAMVLLALAWLLSLLGSFLWPTWWWIEIKQVKVSDGPWPQVMAVDRVIHRDFYGRYNVAVYRRQKDGWVAVCTAEKQRLYRAGAVLPDDLTLAWWTDGGDCTADKFRVPGLYNMKTAWTIPGWAFLPDKDVHILSNIWSVP